MDLWLKRIWLTIGILILLGAVVGIISMAVLFLSDTYDGGGPIATSTTPDTLVSQGIGVSIPTAVGRTSFVYIPLIVKDLSTPLPRAAYEAKNFGNFVVNILFANRDGTDPHLLLDRKAFISSIRIPRYIDSLWTFCLFQIAFEDTDGDGRINHNDRSRLYVSDLNGRNLLPVLPDSLYLDSFDVTPAADRVFLIAKIKPLGGNAKFEDWPERLYLFNLRSRTLAPYPENDESLRRAKDLLWGK